MGTAYSGNWDCSAAGRGGAPVLTLNLQRSWCPAAPYTLQYRVSFRANALRWAIPITNMPCRASDVRHVPGLHVSDVPGGPHLNGFSCLLLCHRHCINTCSGMLQNQTLASRKPCEACNRPKPPIAAVSRTRRPVASVSRTRLTPRGTQRRKWWGEGVLRRGIGPKQEWGRG